MIVTDVAAAPSTNTAAAADAMPATDVVSSDATTSAIAACAAASSMNRRAYQLACASTYYTAMGAYRRLLSCKLLQRGNIHEDRQ